MVIIAVAPLAGAWIEIIYEVLPQLLELWHLNMEKDVEAKKNGIRVVGK